MAHVDGNGIRIRFVDKWFIAVDPNPSAMSEVMCSKCGAKAVGWGASLVESTERATEELAKHQCRVFLGTISG